MSNVVDERGYSQIFQPRPAQAVRLQRRADRMIAEMRLPAAAAERARLHILELGCGTGELADYLAARTGAHVTGVDLSPGFVEAARAKYRRPNLDFMVADLNRDAGLPANGQFDYIVGNGILHHLHGSLPEILPRLARRLVPGGRLIAWEPNYQNPYIYFIFTYRRWRVWAKLEPGEMAFTARFIADRLAEAGFAGSNVQTRDFLLPNVPAGLIKPVIVLGGVLERIPLVRAWAQSLFIVAEKPRLPP